MRNISDSVKALLQREDLSLCYLFKLSLASGVSYYYTDNSQSIRYGGQIWRADPGIEMSAIRDAANAVSQTATVDIGYADDMITEEMVRKGGLDGAIHQVLIIDYRNVAAGAFEVFSGQLDRLTASNRFTFSIDLKGWQGRSYNINGVYSLKCRNIFCDKGCTLHIEDYSIPIVVDSSTDSGTTVIVDTLLQAKFADNGSILWTAGPNAGSVSPVATNGADNVTLVTSPGYSPRPGDEGVLRAGCDYYKSTCKDRYNNLANFQAEPSVPQGTTTKADASVTKTTTDNSKPPTDTATPIYNAGQNAPTGNFSAG